MTQKINADAFPGLLRPGMTVFVQGATGEPTTLMAALAEAPEASNAVHYLACLLPGVNRTDPAGFHPNARLTSFFVYPDIEASYEAGKVRFMPLHYSGVYDYLARQDPVDAALIQVAPPDADGNCSLGPSVDFATALIGNARLLIAEVNHAMPSPPGAPTVPYARLDYAVETDRPLIALETGEVSGAVEAVGRHVAGLIEDGDTIQIGIGKLPAAILSQLHDKRNLGLHGGMVADEVADLVDGGSLTGAAKTIDTGVMVCGAALGSRRLYDWVANREDLQFRPASYTHNVSVIAEIDNFVSINSVLELDLTGQANAETVRGRQISGTGGLVDFVRGARMSKNGRSILALQSTAGNGKVSRIEPQLGEAAVVSCLRADIDYVVTEHGVARLRDKSLDERAAALVAIADPRFRKRLTADWEKLRGRRLPAAG